MDVQFIVLLIKQRMEELNENYKTAFAVPVKHDIGSRIAELGNLLDKIEEQTESEV